MPLESRAFSTNARTCRPRTGACQAKGQQPVGELRRWSIRLDSDAKVPFDLNQSSNRVPSRVVTVRQRVPKKTQRV
jgi:hypothetical protein